MSHRIRCSYEEKITKREDDSRYLPSSLRNKGNIHRLKINGLPGSFEHILAELSWPEVTWLAFFSTSSKDDKFISGDSIDCKLTWFQQNNLDSISFDRYLYCIYGKSAQVVERVIDTGLWDMGAGIVIPSDQKPDDIIKKAISTQLTLGRKLTKTVLNDFGCIIFAEPDSWGVNVIWTEQCKKARDLSDWAARVMDEFGVT